MHYRLLTLYIRLKMLACLVIVALNKVKINYGSKMNYS